MAACFDATAPLKFSIDVLPTVSGDPIAIATTPLDVKTVTKHDYASPGPSSPAKVQQIIDCRLLAGQQPRGQHAGGGTSLDEQLDRTGSGPTC